MRDRYTITELCDAFEVSRSGYYKSMNAELSERMEENKQIINEMKCIHEEGFKRAYGSPRMTVQLHNRGFTCSENRVTHLMAVEGLKARHKSAFHPKTTVQNPDQLPSPNRLSEAEPPGRPGKVLISDITYVATAQGWMYLAVTLDLFSRQVAGWHLAESMKTALIIEAAHKATKNSGIGRDTIYHSDRGGQYTSLVFRAWLKQRGMISSMSAAGYCYDNATCESFFATLKREVFPENCAFQSKAEARRTIFEYIETFYHQTRIHTSLENNSPNQILSKHFHNERITLN